MTLGKLMDILGWTVIWYAASYFTIKIGYALLFSEALREVLR
jgi:hypothetical protein